MGIHMEFMENTTFDDMKKRWENINTIRFLGDFTQENIGKLMVI
jgi:hypothetical protein